MAQLTFGAFFLLVDSQFNQHYILFFVGHLYHSISKVFKLKNKLIKYINMIYGTAKNTNVLNLY